MRKQFYIEYKEDGFRADCYWESVFPKDENHKARTHPDWEDALSYMTDECDVSIDDILIIDDEGSTWASQYNA